jgi:hypothetical protein
VASLTAISASYGETLHHCVACGGKHIYFWRMKNFQYTANQTEEAFHIHRCANCGTGFLNQPPHIKWLQAIYQFSGQALTKPISLEAVLAHEAEFQNCVADAQRMSYEGLKALFYQHGFSIVKVEHITRIPANALSKRLRLQGKLASFVNALVKPLQVPFSYLMNFLGMGIYINIYAVKD